MHKKEYRQLAEMVAGLPPSIRKADLIEALCQEFETSSVSFDREKFIEACNKAKETVE